MHVHNDTDDDVEYSLDEGPGTGKLYLASPLRKGEKKTLPIINSCFSIEFYRKSESGEHGEPIAVRREVPKDSVVRLYCPAPDCWAVEVQPAKAA